MQRQANYLHKLVEETNLYTENKTKGLTIRAQVQGCVKEGAGCSDYEEVVFKLKLKE